MSSPVHHSKNLHAAKNLRAAKNLDAAEDVDPALIYAPPRVRADHSVRGFLRRRAGIPPEGETAEHWSERSDDAEPQFDGDRAVLQLRRWLSRDPEAVPVPPRLDKGIPIERIALRLCVVGCVGALIAWALTSNISWVTRLPATARLADAELTKADAVPQFVAKEFVAKEFVAKEFAAESVKLFRFGPATAAQPAPAAALANAEPAPAKQTVAANPPHEDPSGITPPATKPAVASSSPALGSEEVARLVERGKSYLNDGDIASARLLLGRAAEAGSAEAALTLGSTFDPRVIQQLGAIGVSADPAQARAWYQKAARLGSPTAARQLSLLADR
ncbi:MAG TPA: SEL1-like repeat protein [Xanthobacteraceae bacterium]|nr:SEL1-like repeat protein [Xanthobacteraceae bacterium]